MDYLDLTAGDIIFESDDHLLFFVDAMQYCGRDDARHRALFYCLGIESAVWAHIEDVYGFEENEIRLECLQCAWMEERYAKVVRMAFNLYGSGMLDGELPEYDFRRYTPDDLFCCSYGPYFWEAVRIRYPEAGNPEARASPSQQRMLPVYRTSRIPETGFQEVQTL